jgi:hypothetical protein
LRSTLLFKIKSFYFPNALIVDAPQIVSPKKLKIGDLTVDCTLIVSVNDFEEISIIFHMIYKNTGIINEIQGRAITATITIYIKS